jgi:hypothetical protein
MIGRDFEFGKYVHTYMAIYINNSSVLIDFPRTSKDRTRSEEHTAPCAFSIHGSFPWIICMEHFFAEIDLDALFCNGQGLAIEIQTFKSFTLYVPSFSMSPGNSLPVPMLALLVYYSQHERGYQHGKWDDITLPALSTPLPRLSTLA